MMESLKQPSGCQHARDLNVKFGNMLALMIETELVWPLKTSHSLDIFIMNVLFSISDNFEGLISLPIQFFFCLHTKHFLKSLV